MMGNEKMVVVLPVWSLGCIVVWLDIRIGTRVLVVFLFGLVVFLVGLDVFLVVLVVFLVGLVVVVVLPGPWMALPGCV